jgi:hypothetical protein
MNFDEVENYLAAERERRKTPRERELEAELQAIAIKHRKAMVAESGPVLKELAEIEARKPPMPIVLDGKVFEYVGPGALR